MQILLDASFEALADASRQRCEIDIDVSDFANASQNESLSGTIPAHSELLDLAIERIDEVQFGKLKSALLAEKALLHWKVDDGGYYDRGADVGAGYRNGNMHALLVGPQNAPIQSDKMLMGLFLLAPWTLYRDHRHLAPEVYVPLTGPSQWRFDFGKWKAYPAGSVIYNAPDVVHATAVNEVPFLALFAWTRDIHSRCAVVNAKDWDAVEKRLEAQSGR